MADTISYPQKSTGLQISITREEAGKDGQIQLWRFARFTTVDIEGKILFFDGQSESPEFYRQIICDLMGQIAERDRQLWDGE